MSQISNIQNWIFLQQGDSKRRLFYRSPWTNSCTCKSILFSAAQETFPIINVENSCAA